jgi:Beta-ketoacyl synthase, N-terminal domain
MAIDVQNTCHINGDVATGNLANAGGSVNRVNGAYSVNGYGAGTAAQVDRINDHSSHDSLEPSRLLPSKPIAIIGLSCRLPGQATNPEKLWELCIKGLSAWSEVPELRFNQKAFHHTDYQRMGMVSSLSFNTQSRIDYRLSPMRKVHTSCLKT